MQRFADMMRRRVAAVPDLCEQRTISIDIDIVMFLERTFKTILYFFQKK